MGSRRVRRWTTVAAVGAVALFAAPAQAGAATPLKWKSCHADAGPGFECAVARVPLDYDRPAGAQIDLALVRLPASDPERRIGSLFLNPGGPGGSGVDFVLGAGPFLYADEVRARFDLVGFDPRGIARSTPLRCYAAPSQWPQWPVPYPVTPEEEAGFAATDRAINAACAKRGGPIIDHMSTANVARDLDVLRELVGDEQLTFAGYSYGSYLAATYANLFPERVRAIVADGVLDPVAWATGRSAKDAQVPFSTRLHSAAGAMLTLNQFFALCDAAGPRCAFSGRAARRYAVLVRRLREDPVTVTFDDGFTETIDDQVLIAISLGFLYDSYGWEAFAGFLAFLESQAEADATTLRAASVQRPPAVRSLPYRVHRATARPGTVIEERYPNFIEGFPGVACSDTVNPDDYSAWSIHGAREEARFGYFGRLWTWITSQCAEWPGADEDRYLGPWNARTANPVLVVGNLFDPATPYQGARALHDLLPNSALLTVRAWGHTSLFQSSCADQVVSRYLVDLVTPRPGTVCRADVVPFAAE